jgi:uncharacterized protein (TIGR02246 family)
MDDTQRMLIERECDRLVTAYCHLVDHGKAAKVADLFSKDGVWTGPGVKMEGREQLRAGFQQRQDQTERMSRHVCHNFLCDVIDADHAEGVVYLTLYRHDGEAGRKVSPLAGPAVVGEYRDRFERTAEGWRIRYREIGVSFVASDT